MESYKILNSGKNTGKWYEIEVTGSAAVGGLFSTATTTEKMRLILYQVLRGADLDKFVENIWNGRQYWRSAKNGCFVYQERVYGSAIIANKDGDFPTRGVK
jgi:hypothetical protein